MKLDDSDNTSEQAKSPTPTSTDTKIDQILDKIWAYGIDWTEYKDKSEHDHEVSTFAGKIKAQLKEAMKDDLKTLLTSEKNKALVEELNRIWEQFCEVDQDTDYADYIKERLAQLKSTNKNKE